MRKSNSELVSYLSHQADPQLGAIGFQRVSENGFYYERKIDEDRSFVLRITTGSKLGVQFAPNFGILFRSVLNILHTYLTARPISDTKLISKVGITATGLLSRYSSRKTFDSITALKTFAEVDYALGETVANIQSGGMAFYERYTNTEALQELLSPTPWGPNGTFVSIYVSPVIYLLNGRKSEAANYIDAKYQFADFSKSSDKDLIPVQEYGRKLLDAF